MPGTAGGMVRCSTVTVARAISSDVYFFLQFDPICLDNDQQIDHNSQWNLEELYSIEEWFLLRKHDAHSMLGTRLRRLFL